MLVSKTGIMVSKAARVKPGTRPKIKYANKLQLVSEDASLELLVPIACYARTYSDVNPTLRTAPKANFPRFRAYSASNR
jgi:hypothetical protein